MHTNLDRSSRPPPSRLHVRRVIAERRVAMCNGLQPPPLLEEGLGAVRVQGSDKVSIVKLFECGDGLGAVRVQSRAEASIAKLFARFPRGGPGRRSRAGHRRGHRPPKVTDAFYITAERSCYVARRESPVAVFLAPQGKGAKGVVVTCMGGQRVGERGNTGGAGTAAIMTATGSLSLQLGPAVNDVGLGLIELITLSRADARVIRGRLRREEFGGCLQKKDLGNRLRRRKDFKGRLRKKDFRTHLRGRDSRGTGLPGVRPEGRGSRGR